VTCSISRDYWVALCVAIIYLLSVLLSLFIITYNSGMPVENSKEDTFLSVYNFHR
jgi:hypothetical protein